MEFSLERIALDVCWACRTGTRDANLNYPETFCHTEGCAFAGRPRSWDGLAERQQVMWPKELMDVVRWARVTLPCAHECGHKDNLRAALSAWDAVLEGVGGDGDGPKGSDVRRQLESKETPGQPGPLHPIAGLSHGQPTSPSAPTVPPAGWSPATLPAPSHSHEPAPDGHAGGGAPVMGTCANSKGIGPHERGIFCRDWQPLLPDYVTPLRDLAREVLRPCRFIRSGKFCIEHNAPCQNKGDEWWDIARGLMRREEQ